MSEPTADAPSDLIQEIKTRRKEAREKRDKWLEEATTCYGLVAGGGQQWSDDDKRILKETDRIPIEFNRAGPTVDVVVGMEVGNRQETNYLPREPGDSGPDEVLTGAAKWVRDECDAEDEESEAFWDMTVCGEGWMETRLDYEYDPDGMILMERTDPFEMLPDGDARKKNYRDMEYVIREKMVDLDWAKDTWPEKADELTLGGDPDADNDEVPGDPHRNIIGDQYQNTQTSRNRDSDEYSKKLVKLTEYQRKKRKPIFRVINPATGKAMFLEAHEHEKVRVAFEAQGIPMPKSVKQSKCEHWRAFSIGDTLLEDMLCPDPDSFTYKAMTAKRDRNKGQWYGLVRGMLDPQRWANKFLSQTMHIMNTNAKGGVMAEEGAVSDMPKFLESYARSDKVTVVAAGALTNNKIQPKVPPPIPPEIANLLTFSIQAIRDTSGVSVELLGMADREQPASLEYQRKQAGITILATLFDALRKYRKEQGRNLLYLIQTYISDGRLVRIVGKQSEQYVPLTRQDGTAKYDVIVDESPSSPNQKEKTWAVLQTLLPLLMKANIPMPPEALDYLPLPQSMIDALKKPDPAKQAEAEKQKQLAERAAVAKITRDEAAAQKDAAQAGTLQNDGQIELAALEAEGQQKQAEQQADLMKTIMESQSEANQHASDQAIAIRTNQVKMRELDVKEKEIEQRHREAMMPKPAPASSSGGASKSNGSGDGQSAAVLSQVADALDKLADAMNKPKRLVRDESGRAIGSEAA